MKLANWAKEQGIAYCTAWRWFKNGKLPCPAYKSPSGTIIVNPIQTDNKIIKTYIYARVSSYEKKNDLLRQTKRCEDFCLANGWSVERTFSEIASGMNDNRKKLFRLLSLPPGRLVVEHKDRLTRFGFNYFDFLLPKLGWEVIVINRDTEEKNDLLKDLVAIITSFCCRLYGLRRGQSKAKQIKQELTNA